MRVISRLDEFAFFLNNVTADMTPTQWEKFCKAAVRRNLFSAPFLAPSFTERVTLEEAKALRDEITRDLGHRNKNPEMWFARLLASLNQLELKTKYRCMPLRLYGKPHPGQTILKSGKQRFVPLVHPEATTPRELLYVTLGAALIDGTLERLKACGFCKNWTAGKNAGRKFCSLACKDNFNNQRRLKEGYFNKRRANIRRRRAQRTLELGRSHTGHSAENRQRRQ